MIKMLRKLWNDRQGNALLIGAACLPMIIGAAGLANDTIQWTLWKRQLQRAADSAAMAAVYTRINNDTQAAVEDAVAHDKALDLHTWMALNATPTVERLADNGQARKPVKVTFSIQQSLPFSSMFMSAAPTITAVSTAASVPGSGEYCVIGLDPSSKVTGVTISGSTYLDLGDCSLIANSTNPTLAASNGSSSANGGKGSTVKASTLAAAGGVNYSASWSVSSYEPYSSPVDDPFYSLKDSIPTSTTACSKTISIESKSDIDRTTATGDTASQIVCLSGSQTIQSKVKLGPATYVVNGGDLTMNSNGSSLSCDGCTIIMTNFSDPTKTGSVKLTGGSLNLSPPRPAVTDPITSAVTAAVGNQTWKGIVFYQDPRSTDDGKTSTNQINGNTATSLQGAVYFGNQSLLYNGGGSDVAACLQVVAKRVTFSGNSKIQAASKCGGYGMGQIGGARRVKLVA